MFGLGGPELLILLALGAGAVAAVLVVLSVARKGGRAGALEEENRRLRDQLDRERRRG